ncbi:aminopeptidase [Candidatus Woesearchaeota archaeon]|nr:aminopeptidase [Candidatus Woesearchaeota archaeon]
MATVAEASRFILMKVFRLQRSESLIVVTDTKRRRLAEKFFAVAKGATPHAVLVEIPELSLSGQEPPRGIAEAMGGFDAAVLMTTASLTHTVATTLARKRGARIASMPGITETMMRSGIVTDLVRIIRTNRRLMPYLSRGKTITITAPGGTDITASIAGRRPHADDGLLHRRGGLINIPSGEVFIAPVEGTAHGRYVVDATIAGGRAKSLSISVERGRAAGFSGDRAREVSALFRRPELKRYGRRVYTVAEIGIGTNPTARIVGSTLQDEKVLGTAHIALGKNTGFGGRTEVPVHYDGVFRRPTIAIDGRAIMQDGRLLV